VRRRRETWRVDAINSLLGLTDNGHYGHDWALARYCTLALPRVVSGKIQHGWAPDLPHYVQPVPFRGNWLPPLTWSRRFANEATKRFGTAMPIGAPFLYLLAIWRRKWSLISNPERAEPERGALFYPLHAWEGGDVEGSHERLAHTVERELGADTTICLYYYDYERAACRGAYEDRGLRTIRHASSRTDPVHLDNQLRTLLTHRSVYSNHASTALLYGAVLGREVGIVGPSFRVKQSQGEPVLTSRGQQVEALLRSGLAGDDARSVGQEELGWECMIEPERLVSTLGWDWRHQALLHAVAARRALRVAP
jgi:hypothetical protein